MFNDLDLGRIANLKIYHENSIYDTLVVYVLHIFIILLLFDETSGLKSHMAISK